MAWTDGYEAATTWIGGYHRWQAPNLLAYLAIQQGYLAPQWENGFRYLELGCGSGLTSVVLAAANPDAEIHGNDFDPAAISIARAIVKMTGVENATFHEKSFADFSSDRNPGFDFITTGLVYSWVSEENHGHIHTILRDSLNTGGFFALGYLAKPGSTARDAVQALLYQFFHTASGEPAQKARAAIEFVLTLAKSENGFFAKFPEARRFIQSIATMAGGAALHEFINANYRSFYRHEINSQMAEVKLSPLGSLVLGQNEPGLCLDDTNLTLYRTTADHQLRALIKDYCLNSEANADLFCRGLVRLADVGKSTALQDQRFALVRPTQDLADGVGCGQRTFPMRLAQPILTSLAPEPQSFGQLLGIAEIAAMGPEQLRLWLILLIDSGYLQPALPQPAIPGRLASCWRFNEAILRMTLPALSSVSLASPVLGAGISLDGETALFARAYILDRENLAEAASRLLKQRENIDFPGIESRAESFHRGWLPVLKTLRCLN